MPELPEVETLRRELNRVLVGLKIQGGEILWSKTINPHSPHDFFEQLKNKKIVGVKRRAKILFIDLEGPMALAIHLKMTGQLIFVPPVRSLKVTPKGMVRGGHPDDQMTETQPSRYTRLFFVFSNKSKLYFNDLRKFGWIKIVDDKQIDKLVEGIGPEPLSPIFTPETLINVFKKYPKRTIKQILLDQKLIAGIGNIYADEACFLSKLNPTRKASTLKPAQIKNLRDNIIKVLKLSIQKKGTSSKNYRRSDGSRGNFVPYLNVYGRENQPCKICGRPIQKIRHAGRGTHFCPHCQECKIC